MESIDLNAGWVRERGPRFSSITMADVRRLSYGLVGPVQRYAPTVYRSRGEQWLAMNAREVRSG
ncbi:hypothetical protein FRAAL3302 [Frankia alni ACN14a]|uniref:Uncharacterized protein n=1 Tax=Frankia alni (strain DSM 45986 / CECT 9034 / ACN14a) TaxID=326424 RepID=Q0RKL2_FRAAA|nr:hypothetical protein FRAAL3302 [Frankia alni ACN14a]